MKINETKFFFFLVLSNNNFKNIIKIQNIWQMQFIHWGITIIKIYTLWYCYTWQSYINS